MAAIEDNQDMPREPRGHLRIPPEAFADRLTVRSYEAGRSGGVRPGVIQRYLEHLATTASATLGFDNRWYREHNGAWVVREMSLLLGDLPSIDDELRLYTWVADFRRVQATRDYLITRADTGRLVARASARWAYIDRVRQLPARIPDEITARMGPWGYQMRLRPPAQQPTDAAAAAEMPLTAREYEADTQQHINNCVYLDWFDEAAQQAAAAGALTGDPLRLRPRFYHLEYIRAALPGDALTVSTAPPTRAQSRGLGFWQTIATANGPIARAWTESLVARP
ncbi:MAG TPA: acyl-ACP thioesterase domain-containing protein [Ktedonobacterales bacterium]